MLTDKIVDHFLSKKLKMFDWRLKLETNKLDFLKHFVLAHQHQHYYQNVSWSAVPKPDRKWPTLEEIIYYGSPQSSTAGGTCIHIAYFVKLILDHLGFDTFVVGVEAERWRPALRSHMATVVRLPVVEEQRVTTPAAVEHNLYYLDQGFFGPFVEPICLNKLPYVGRSGGFDFEYLFNPEKQVYELWELLGSPVRGPHDADRLRKLNYYFDLTPLELDDFHEAFDVIFSPNLRSCFLELLILFRLTKAVSPLDFEYVAFQALTMVEGTRDSYRETKFESYEVMLPVVIEKFPNLNIDELNKALPYYIACQKEKDAAAAAADAEPTAPSEG